MYTHVRLLIDGIQYCIIHKLHKLSKFQETSPEISIFIDCFSLPSRRTDPSHCTEASLRSKVIRSDLLQIYWRFLQPCTYTQDLRLKNFVNFEWCIDQVEWDHHVQNRWCPKQVNNKIYVRNHELDHMTCHFTLGCKGTSSRVTRIIWAQIYMLYNYQRTHIETILYV